MKSTGLKKTGLIIGISAVVTTLIAVFALLSGSVNAAYALDRGDFRFYECDDAADRAARQCDSIGRYFAAFRAGDMDNDEDPFPCEGIDDLAFDRCMRGEPGPYFDPLRDL